MVFAKGYEQSLYPFRDSEIEGKEKQASEREIDCGSTVALAFKDVGAFRPRSLVYFCKGIPGLASYADDLLELVFIKRYIRILLHCSLFVFRV